MTPASSLPCCFRSLGNEGGEGGIFRAMYDWLKTFDASRPVQYEPAKQQRYTDIVCPMYPSLEAVEEFDHH